jgi:integrase
MARKYQPKYGREVYEAVLGRKKREQDKFPEKDEIAALLKHARKESQRDYMLLFITANLGLRCTEAVSLDRKALSDLKRGILRVRTAKVKGNPVDDLPISGTIKPVIEKYIASMEPGQKFLFPGSKGRKHISERTARYIFAYHAQAAKIRKILSYHCLRHFCGLIIWEATENIKAVQRMLRHRSEKTSWIYAHVTFGNLKEIIEEIPAFK